MAVTAYTYIGPPNIIAATAITAKFHTISTPLSKVVRIIIGSLLAAFAVYMMWLNIGWPLYRAWWERPAAFLPFRDVAAKTYEKTKAADLLSDTGAPASQDARLGYHAFQLVHYAKFAKATFYGNKTPSTVMEPIPVADLWTGKRDDDMRSWITENSIAYSDLSLRRRELRRVIGLVRRAVKAHTAQLNPSRDKGEPD